MTQKPPTDACHEDGNGDANDETIFCSFKSVDDIHSVDAGYQRGSH